MANADAPWLLTQSWNDLLFAHWRADASQMRQAVPDVFDLDLFDGEAWLGIVPFYMTNIGDYQSARRGARRAEFSATYEPASAPFAASAGSIEYFLTERYCLYHRDRRGRPYRLEIHHRPWSLHLARAEISLNTMAAASHLAITGAPTLLHFAHRQDVVAWAPTRISAAFGTSRSNATPQPAESDVHRRSAIPAS
jgi:uncharacterized protein YqjF (DUF2071 family)